MISYNELLDALSFGSEIEFTYEDEEYSITVGQIGTGGRIFADGLDDENYLSFLTTEDLLDEVRIGGLTLEQVFNSGNITDYTIY